MQNTNPTPPKLSVVIPCYTLNHELEEMALTAANCYRRDADELIIVEDGGIVSKDLAQIADVYIHFKDNGGFSVNVNRGWKYAHGDFVAIASSDTMLISGNLKDLCVPGKVTSPTIENQFIPRLAGPFFVVPKEVTKERGYLIEELRTYSSDSEYDQRTADIFQKVDSVVIYHQMAQTVKAAGVEGGAEAARDQETYQRLKAEGKAK